VNKLSLFIYLADVLRNICGIFVVSGIIGSSFCGVLLLASVLSDDDEDKTTAKSLLKKYTWIPVFSFLVASLIPSQSTMYAIAASEMGEQVLTSSTMTKAQKAVDMWLDKQIENNKEDKK